TGAESAIVAPFLAEFIQSRYRGRFLGSLSGFFSFGFVLAAILGYVVVPASEAGWRVVQVLTALPIVMLLWWRRALPESPRWLMQKGRSVEAEQVVAQMEEEVRHHKGDLVRVDISVSVLPVTVQKGGSIGENLLSLWSPALAKSTAMLWILWISITFCY